ncbi:unnamed protein product [Aphanomyces euteiches]
MASVWNEIVRCRDLWRAIVVYQPGVFMGLVPLIPLERLPISMDDSEFVWPLVRALRVQHTTLSRKILEPWYNRYSVRLLPLVAETKPKLSRVLAVHAVVTADLSVLSALDDVHVVSTMKSKLLEVTAFEGHFEVVKYLLNRDSTTIDLSKAMALAATENHLNVLVYLHSRSSGCILASVMDEVAAKGFLSVVKYLHDHNLSTCSTQAMDKAAMNGHLEIVYFLHQNRHEGCTQAAQDGAAGNGHLDVVKFLHQMRSEGCSPRAMEDAAANGHLEVVKFLHCHRSEGCRQYAAIDRAAADGHLAVIKFLHRERGMSCSSRALFGDNLEVLQFLHENVCVSRTVCYQLYAFDACERTREPQLLRAMYDIRSISKSSPADCKSCQLYESLYGIVPTLFHIS